MARTIDPKALRELRTAKGWSLEELAEKANVDKQTIHRIEQGKLKRSQRETIGRLCKALDVEERMLIGGHAREASDYEDDAIEPKHIMRQKVSAGVSNAYLLVAKRYGVSMAQIAELAPFLFFVAAERSLRRREQKLSEAWDAIGAVQSLPDKFPHLPGEGFFHEPQGLDFEQKSVKQKDLFGRIVDEAPIHYGDSGYDSDEDNPFAAFLKEEAADVGLGAEFSDISQFISPRYRVALQEAAEVVGKNELAVRGILDGGVFLQKMPKEIREGTVEQRANWVLQEFGARIKSIDEALGINDDADKGAL